MKNPKNIIIAVLAVILILSLIFACNSGSNGDASKSDSTTKDSSILDNYNNEYPNNRIHLNDSNLAKDSPVKNGVARDSIKK
jgi:hypothetical protein